MGESLIGDEMDIEQFLEYQEGRRNGLRLEEGNHNCLVPTHKQTAVTIRGEQVSVDEGIVPTVEWLNAIGAETTNSCQGNYHEGKGSSLYHHCFVDQPYVSFKCSESVLKQIMEEFSKFCDEHERANCIQFHNIGVEVHCYNGSILFVARWYDRLALEDFQQWLEIKQ